MSPHRKEEIGTQCRENGYAGDLEGQTGDHDVDARLLHILVIGGVGKSAAEGLQHEREDVAADEDDGVGAGFQTGEMLTVGEDDAREGEVDGCGEETGGDG